MAIKTIIFTLWEKLPWPLKWFFGLIVVPNYTIALIVFFTWYQPWHYDTIKAVIHGYEVQRDKEMQALIREQNLKFKNLEDDIAEIKLIQRDIYNVLIKP